MKVSSVDADRFVSSVQPLLKGRDLPGLLKFLKSNWTAEEIVGLLSAENQDARKVAALCLGLVGTHCCIKPLADRLRDDDPMVNQMAEHALWQIWFRMSSPEANHQ